jgi:kynurenine formamidase
MKILRFTIAAVLSFVGCVDRLDAQETKFVDLSLLVAPNYPCTWPTGFPVFQISHVKRIGPESAYNIDVLTIDGNTGTQLDVPPHSVARPELKFENSGKFGNAFTEVIEPWQFVGEACVVDITDLLDKAAKGVSPLVRPLHIERFEKQHRKVGFGDVVLFRSGYSDKYYRPFPAGHRFISAILERKAPGYPNPDPECMEFLAKRKVMILGTDSASMGPLPNLAEPTHYAGLKHGMVWTESATNLGQLPATGALYCMLGPRHKGGMYGEGRAFAIIGGELPKRLIQSARAKRAIELSPVLAMDLPVSSTGFAIGKHRHPYIKVDFLHAPNLDLQHHTHIMDSQAGTHLVPPAFALASKDGQKNYAPEVRGWLSDFQKRFGPLGHSDMTTEKVPLSWTCGDARVIDVRHLVGSTKKSAWPASPAVTPEHIKAYEKEHGILKAGQVVVFHTGHIDQHFKPKPDDAGVWTDPIAGKSEGWPALGVRSVLYLAERGIKCVATDAPDLGGVDPRNALMTYWALGTKKMVGVEFLYNVGKIPAKNAYFLFAPVKIRDCHGGPGRAIVLY